MENQMLHQISLTLRPLLMRSLPMRPLLMRSLPMRPLLMIHLELELIQMMRLLKLELMQLMTPLDGQMGRRMIRYFTQIIIFYLYSSRRMFINKYTYQRDIPVLVVQGLTDNSSFYNCQFLKGTFFNS